MGFFKDFFKGAGGAVAKVRTSPEYVAHLKAGYSRAGAFKTKLDGAKARFVARANEKLTAAEAAMDSDDARALHSDRIRRIRKGLPITPAATPAEIAEAGGATTSDGQESPMMDEAKRREAANTLANVYWLRVAKATIDGDDVSAVSMNDLLVDGDDEMNDMIVRAIRANKPAEGEVVKLEQAVDASEAGLPTAE